ncbi:MAG: hypothetical protein NT062_03985 [Proteobacteria bacterium]|nr:hypothetical protein [Pseudomonadota bacterium]
MLFSSPDYPIFLIAVFFLYALARWGDLRFAWARYAIMLLLGDLVFLLVSKDPETLWDPLGGALYRLVASDGNWSADLAWRWPIGLAVVFGAAMIGRRGGGWILSARGQATIARCLVLVLACVGALVYAGSSTGLLDAITVQVVAHGHLAVLFVLGVGIGASAIDRSRSLGRVIVLFVASSLFYHAWAAAMPGPYRYLLSLLLATIVLDYYLGIWIEGTDDPRARKLLVAVSLVSNLGILVFFKYADFFAQDVLHLPVDRLNLILPAGISFHTFQSLSYTIDVYRRELRATRSVVQFATFVLFFPQLVAGPIVRAQELLPQLDTLPPLDLQRATRGLYLIVVGLFKKIAVADALALSIVDRVFEAPERFSAIEVVAGVYGYALQIYLDFSAYSDIAIGSAQVIGFTLPENFRTPYRSANLQEFWRRWHISLSTWLRDYLYITLGGGRGAPWRMYVNLSLTMLLGGLWHGASWAFIVWGALHGFGLAVTRYFQRASAARPASIRAMFVWCAAIAAGGFAIQLGAMDDAGTWSRIVLGWICTTPLWAVVTAWLGSDPWTHALGPTLAWGDVWFAPHTRAAELLRYAMLATMAGALAAMQWLPSAWWIPAALVPWACALAADVVESSPTDPLRALAAVGRRAIATVLVFQYVCLAWIFFRATSFANALAVLRQIGRAELDHANLVPLVTTALVVGFAAHFFADGSFRWMRDRFVALPAWAQGLVLAVVALVLRELAHTKIVPFIYFQF